MDVSSPPPPFQVFLDLCATGKKWGGQEGGVKTGSPNLQVENKLKPTHKCQRELSINN